MATNRANRTNGIHWNGRIYSRISGPLSLSYLHPPSDHPELPLVLLLGDRHGMHVPCDPCDARAGCLSVIDQAFFDDLDELALEIPIDVFTETNWSHKPNENNSQVLFHHFVKKTQSCYDVTKRSVQSSPCPTQFVRWHHVDTRLMVDARYMEWHIGNLLMFTRSLYEISSEKQFGFAYPTFSSSMFSSSDKTDWQDKEIRIAVQLITILFQPRKNVENITKEIVDLFFSLMNTYPSIIRKDLAKQSLLEIEPLQETIVQLLLNSEVYTNAVDRMVKYTGLDPSLMAVFQEIIMGVFETKRFMYSYPMEKRTKTIERDIDIIEDVIESFYHVLLLSSATLLDIYAVARMVKKPEGNDRGILHIGYYGNRHCEGIEYILKKLLRYSVQAKYPLQEDSNCIVLRHPLRIEQDMNNLAAERYRRHPQLHEEYKHTISRESKGRIEHISHGGTRRTRRRIHRRRGVRRTHIKK